MKGYPRWVVLETDGYVPTEETVPYEADEGTCNNSSATYDPGFKVSCLGY